MKEIKQNKKEVIECSHAIAEAARLCKPSVIAAYPITPQTHIVEKLAEFVNNGILNAEYINVESEHSAMSACVGAQATGVRTFTATNSQGMALMSEIMFVASGMRLPIVMAVANRALSSPINIWNDQSDTIAQRDSGWVQLYCESSQEAFDTTIQAYKIAEKVLLPVMVCVDGFTLSHVWENVELLEQIDIDGFLPKYNPKNKLDVEKPLTMGPIGMPNSYMYFKKQQHEAMIKSIDVIKETNSLFSKKFKRKYGNGLVETYRMDDADYALACMGSICGTARVVVDDMRKKGKKVGLIKIKCFRPFPSQEIINSCKKLKGLAVVDRDISFGNSGAVFTEVKASLNNKDIKINNFIAGLGGRDVTKEILTQAVNRIGQDKEVDWLF